MIIKKNLLDKDSFHKRGVFIITTVDYPYLPHIFPFKTALKKDRTPFQRPKHQDRKDTNSSFNAETELPTYKGTALSGSHTGCERDRAASPVRLDSL